ncbi:MAG: hypothetical protein AAGG81_04800 [Chlamydiota bacterium]
MLLFMFVFLLVLIPDRVILESTEIEEMAEFEETCILFQGYRSAGLGRGKLTFFNACGKARYVYACLTDTFGGAQLLKSASRVPSGGKVDFYPFIDYQPKSVSWTSARNDPPIPGSCYVQVETR